MEDMLDASRQATLQEQARRDGRECVVSAVITDGAGQAFAFRRSADRSLFPNCWDIPGGHVEPGETLTEALGREVWEETGWRVRRIAALVDVVDWEAQRLGQPIRRREFCFLVEVAGDLTAPILERDKVSETRWLGPDELDLLNEHRAPGDDVLLRLVRRGVTLVQG
jgi:8-oxo-dGTP pyrophosphatase MutT (NUDIX family)